MGLLERSLSKLNICAYTTPERQLSGYVGEIQAMYNPATIDLSYGASYLTEQFFTKRNQANDFQALIPGTLTLELIFDARVPDALTSDSVDTQLTLLRDLCCAIDHESRKPRYLRIDWGSMVWHGHGYYDGRMSNLSVRYELFDRNAVPLRATATLTLIADGPVVPESITPKEHFSTMMPVVKVPDMTPLALVAAGVAFAAGRHLGRAVGNYLRVAYDNNLDSICAANPGDLLLTHDVKVT